MSDQLFREALAQKFSPSYESRFAQIGTDTDSGKTLSLPLEEMSQTHTYILGSSGVGKSKFLERLCRDIIKNRYGLILLDGKGDLYDSLVDFNSYLEVNGFPLAEKTIFIDPNEPSYSVGINYLQLLGEQSPSALASLVVEAFKKFHREDSETKHWLEEWLPACLVPLIQAKLTLLELFNFLNLEDPSFRDTILNQLQEGYYKNKWDRLRGFKRFEQELRLGSVATRADIFWRDEALKAMFGQEQTSIDWLKVMAKCGIVAAKLGRTPRLSERIASFIGATILHQVTTIAPLRPRHQRKPFFFVVDEFQKFVTSDFADALERMRGYGISFILAHQHREQFEREAPEILNSIDANCRNKIVFACSRADAEDIAIDLFTGSIHEGAEETKDEIWQTKFRPVKVYEETVTYSESQTDAHTTSYSSGDSLGASVTIVDGEHIMTSMKSGASGSAAADISAHTSGKSVSRAPFHDLVEFQEMSSRSTYSVEEVKERFIAQVKNQPDRHAYWKFKSNQPVSIFTPTIKPVFVTDAIRERFKEASYQRHARPTAEVFQEIERRVPRFLAQGVGESETTDDPSIELNVQEFLE